MANTESKSAESLPFVHTASLLCLKMLGMRYGTNAKTYLKILCALLALVFAATSLACKIKGDELQKTDSARNPPPARLYPVQVDGRYGFIDEAGNLKFTLSEDVYTIGDFSEGLVVVARRVPNTYGRWGFVDETGKQVIESRFNLAKRFSEGLAAIILSDQESTSGQVGYIDHTGRIVIPPQFSQGGAVSDFAFSEGVAAVVRLDGKWGYIDKAGKFTIAPQFNYAFPFSEGRAVVSVGADSYTAKWGVIDKQGHWIVQPRYESIGEFSEGLATVRVGSKIGFIDAQGQVVIEPQFDSGGGCPETMGGIQASKFSEGLAAVQTPSNPAAPDEVSRKWGFIDRTGKWIIKPTYSCVAPFSEGLAVVGIRGERGGWRFGYIEKTGAVVMEPRFGSAGSFYGKLARVGVGMSEDEAMIKAMDDYAASKPKEQVEKDLENNKPQYGYIDRTGKFIRKPTRWTIQ